MTQKQIKQRKILLDVTVAASVDEQTGIQRVVRNIAKESEHIADELGVICIPIVCHGEHLVAVGFDGKRRRDERIFAAIGRSWKSLHFNIAKFASKFVQSAGDRYLRALSRLRKLFLPKTPIRWIQNKYFGLTRQRIVVNKRDILVLLDASWNLPIGNLIDSAKSVDANVATVVYDLIPVNHPEFHDERLRKVFTNWLDIVVAESDFLVGISQTVAKELSQYADQVIQSGKQVHPCGSHRIDHFRLGANITMATDHSIDHQQTKLRLQKVRNIDTADFSDFYLAVGTIEPRKNHRLLLDTFEKLWEANPDSTLCIAGKIGWMCEDLIERIQSHPRLQKSLFFIETATDAELIWLYQNARALIFPSIVEGFGLPIVEALHHQLPVIASDTDIHREVGGEHCTFFDLSQADGLLNILQAIESGECELTKPYDFKPIGWRESCRELITKIVERFDDDSSQIQDSTTQNRGQAA